MTTGLSGHLVIAEALTRLAVGRGGSLDDITVEVYLSDLQRFDPALVARACERWRTVPRKEFETTLPAVGQLIATIERLAREDAEDAQMRALPPPTRDDEDGPRYACRDCLDHDWGPAMWCPGSGASRASVKHERHAKLETVMCGRPKPHGCHTFVGRCHCWGRNPNVEHRRREAQRKHAEAA